MSTGIPVSSILTEAQIQDVLAAIATAKILDSENPGGLGNWTLPYNILYSYVTVPGSFGALDEAPKAGVDEAVWLWLRGARLVNGGDGPFAHLIREYTKAQYQMRYGEPLDLDKLNQASNGIARAFMEEWFPSETGGLGGFVPDLHQVGMMDAGPTAALVFNHDLASGDFAGWAGIFLFGNLGDDSFYSDLILRAMIQPDAPADPRYTVEHGSYDAAAMAQAIQNYDAWPAVVSFWNDAFWETIGQWRHQQGASPELTAATDSALRDLYGLSQGEPDVKIGSDTFGPSNLVLGNWLKSAHYAVGSVNGDTIGYSVSPNGSYATPRPSLLGSIVLPAGDFINAGRGDDKVYGTTGSDLLDGGEGTNELVYLPGSWNSWADLNLSFDAKGKFDSRAVVEKTTLSGILLGQDKDVAVNFAKITFDYRSIQVEDPNSPSGWREHIGDKADAPWIVVRTPADGIKEAGGILNRSETVELHGDLTKARGAEIKIDLGKANVAYHQDVVDGSAATKGVYINLSTGGVQGLSGRTDVSGTLDWLYTLGGVILTNTRITVENGNEARGSDYSDILIGSSGTRDSGEGYSVLYGGKGNDLLVGQGWESHLYGQEGDDQFEVGSSTWIEDAESHDSVSYGGIPIFGGVKQWWMEGNTAYWSPFSTLLTAFPVIGSELLYTAAFFIDVATMKFASFQQDGNGNLKMSLGWGHGGQAMIKDYSLNLDTGEASAGVVVFQSGGDGNGTAFNHSEDRFTKFVNLALKAGFGIGLNGFDPLVLDLDGDGYELTTEANSRTYFEFDGDGFGERAGWVRGDDGFLVRDANGNGLIDNVTEMFGNASTPGFAVLSGYDVNADGVIDAQDAIYAQLQVWQDRDLDGVTDAGELKTLAQLGIVSISLAATAPAEPTFIGGNRLVDAGHFTWADGRIGNLADFALDINETATRWLGDNTVSAAAAALPELKGFGEIKDLRVAMTGDPALLALVESFVAQTTNDLAALKASAEAILYEWAEVDAVAATAIGANGFDARKLAFLETYSGYQLMPRDANGAVVTTNLAEMEALWADHVTRLTLRLIVQGPMADEFAGISYRADLDLLVADTPTALEDLYRVLLEELPSDPAAALVQWQSWAPLLGAMAEGMRRFDANLVRSDFVAVQLAAAMDGIVQPLSFAQLAGALGIENLRLGTAGDDALARAGASGAAIFVAEGGGTDILTGGSGQDVYIFGRTVGHATINDNEAKPAGDRIRFAFLSPGDVTIRRDGHDLLITVKATGETVRVTGQFADVVPLGSDVLLSSNKGIEDIQFADGTIYEIPEIMTAVGTGTDGDDHMVGTMHSDVLIGGKGDDRLEGGDDADLYVIHAGDGHDVIAEHQSTVLLRAADLLIFGDNIAPGDIALSRAGDGGDDLIVTIGATGQTVRIEGEFGYTSLGYNDKFAPNSRIESFAFKDYGDSFGIKQVQQRLIRESTSDGDDTTRGFGDSDEFFASAGNDILIGMDGVDGYHWGAGAGNDVIDEQARYIDINVGLGGLNLIDGADTILFDGGIVTSDLIFSRTSAAPDLTITLISTGETLTVKNQFDGFQTGPLGPQWMDRVEWFQFSGGIRLSWQDVLLDITTGGAGDDSLWGDLYADTMDGGAGNDMLSGGGLGDTYVFKLGYGQDTLADNNQFILGTGFVTVDPTPDVLRFGPGILPSDIRFVRSGKDLTLLVGTGGDSVTLVGQDDYFHTGVFGAIAYNRIEEVRFEDGTVWTWAELNQQVLTLATTPGNDVAQGFMMADRFEASAGDDVMMGGDSSDTYVFGHGSGHDIIREDVSNVLYGDYDIVLFSPGVTAPQVAVARNGEDLVLTLLDTGDTLTIDGEFAYSNWFEWWDVNEFRFADGTVWTKHDIQVRLLQATASADHLVGFMTGDVLDGGAGDDLMEGIDGGDTYVFGRGYGSDVIRETVTNANLGDNDRLVFGADVLPAQVSFQRDGDDLVVSILGTADTLRVEGQFAFSNWFAWWDIERFEFADGTVLTDRDVANQIMGGTPGDDHIVGTFRSDVLDGGAGNDLLEGGDGADRYVFGRGYGQDEIRETLSNANLSEDDELQFLSGVTLADLGFERVGNDLVVTILGTTDKVTIKGEFDFSNWYTWWDVDRFTFADGSVLTKGQVQQRLLAAGPGADHLVGFMTGDVLDGGAGDDILEGADGADTYLFGRGYGHDIIRETLTNANLSESDRLVFGAGITLADLGFQRVGNDLVITIVGTQDKVTIEGEFSYSNWYTWWDVDHFDFADGTSLTRQDVQQLVLTGTAGNDHLVGFLDGDTIDGKAGNDLLEGGDGGDTYLFGRGYGQDEIRETLGNANLSEYDTVRFGPDIAWSDLRFTRSGDDLIIAIAGTTDSLTLRSQFSTINDTSSATWWDVENFVFADGSSKSSFDIMAEMVKGSDAADTIIGFFTADTIVGGQGNDLLQGGRGGDIYVYNPGDGNDVVSDYVNYWGSDGDTIRFGAGIAPADVTVRRSATQAGDLVLNLAGGGSLTLTHQIDGGREWTIDLVTFADGTSWTKEQLAGFLTSGAATNGDDTIDGTTLPDEIHAGGGNDIVRGNGGNDILDGGAGNDRLEGGDGNDVYHYAPAGGDDFIGEYVNYWGSFDVLKLGAGFAVANLRFARGSADANDLVISFDNSPGTVTVDNYFVARDWGIDQLQFADGAMLTYDQVNALYYGQMATAGADVIAGSYVNDALAGLAGDDRLVGNNGDDGLTGGTGNDRLEGGGGNDTYFYASGDGDDFVAEYVDYWGSFDVVRLGAGFTAANLVVTRGGSDPQDLVISFNNAAGSITVDNYFIARDWGIDQLILADGTILGMTELNNLFFAGKATGGADTIDGSYINDSIAGLGGDDRLVGNNGDDTLTGGLGNDRLEGGGGNDTYVYNSGDGDDFVAEYVDYWGSYDTLQLGAGFTAANLVLNRGTADWNDLVITFTNSGGSVTIDNYWVARDWGIDQLRFADGSTLSADALNALYFGQKATAGNDVIEGGYYAETLQGLAGNDILRGNVGNDTLAGGTGDDRLEGGNDTDTYLYAVGDGNDVISDYQNYWGSWNVIVFGAGIAPADLRFAPSAADNSDLVISFASAAGSITIDNQVLGGREWDVDEVRFADGTVWNYATFMSEYVLRQGSAANDLVGGTNGAETLNGQAGDDTIRAFGGNDVVIGGTGNDQLEGGDGTDLYRYNAGDGDDVVFDRYGPRDNRLVFGAGISANDLILSRMIEDPTDLRITFKTMAGSIIIDHETWSDAGVEILEFADGTILSGATLAARIGPGTSGRDALTGTSGADSVWALEGNDAVSGLAGDDALYGDSGDDALAGGDGNDAVAGGSGDDLLVGDDRIDAGANLLVNGSFETLGGTQVAKTWGATATAMPGWTKSNASVWELVNGGTDSVAATDGARWLDLEGVRPDSNMVISQTVSGRSAGEVLSLRFDAANRTSLASGSFEILWNGQLVGSYAPTSRTMQIFSLLLTAVEGDNVLTFRATGTLDDYGASLDNVRLYATAAGNAGDDVLTGGPGSDVVQGGAGNDIYHFNRGDGADRVAEQPGEGADRIVFGTGIAPADLAFANAANGRDVILSFAGGTETITFLGGATNPTIGIEEFRFADGTIWDQPAIEARIARYTAGPDAIIGTAGDDSLRGGGGDDSIAGVDGNDSLSGDDGNDILDGGLGDDVLNGLEGDDRLLFSAGSDDYRGGNGIDTLDLSAASAAAVLDLAAVSGQLMVGGSASQASGVEAVLGSAYDDSLTGDSGVNRIEGGGGADTIVGGGGNDLLVGGLGNDFFQYSGGSNGFDTVDGGTGTDTIQALTAGTVIGLAALAGVEAISAGVLADVAIAGSADGDTLDFTAVALTGIARIDGGAGNDTITGSAGNDVVAGGSGDDTLAGGLGNDLFDFAGAGEGFDSVDGGGGTDTIRAAAAGTAIGLRSVTGVEAITANGFADVRLTGTALGDTISLAAIALTGIAKIEGLAGDDTITGTGLADTIDGGDGDDTMVAGAGDDNLAGGDGNDVFRLAGAADGFDAVDGGLGSDTIQATAANAVLSFRSVAGVETITANGLAGVSIAGSSGNDSLDFSLATLVGIARIDSAAGNDLVLGSAAAETIVGGAGDDALNGGGGNDIFQVTGAASGFDAVDGGAGTDTIQAMAASTVIGLAAVAGVETITAGTFAGVSIQGSANDDALNFTAVTLTNIVRIDGGAGNDSITGSIANDTILGGAGDDTLAGGAGNDVFQFSGTAGGFDAIDGGAGTNTIQATAASTVIGLRSVTGIQTITGMTGSYIAGSGGNDTLSFLGVTLNTIARIDGGAGNDTITGNSAANILWGGLGNDVLNGDAGADTLVGDDGDDVLTGGLGNDSINGASGIDTVDYSSATAAWTVNLSAASNQGKSGNETDTITNVENVTGGAGADTITGNAVANALKGGGGNDRITGGAGNDNVDGGAGTDVAVFAGLQASYAIVTSGGTIQIVDNQTTTDGNDGTDTLIAIEKAEFKGGVQVALAAPIVLDLDGDGLTLVDRDASAARFDWDGDGQRDRTGWMGAGDGLLVYDRDGDGTVSGAGELSFVNDRAGARSDLDGLRAFDSTGDGIFSAADSAWAEFRVWNDRDGDGSVDSGEFLTLLQAGVESISLAGTATEQRWAMDDNIVVNHGHFTRSDGTAGALGDVALNYVPADGRPAAPPEPHGPSGWAGASGAVPGGRPWQARHVDDPDLPLRFGDDGDGAEAMSALPAAVFGADGAGADPAATIVRFGAVGDLLVTEQPLWP